ncbi:DUF4436 family protein [Kitasatospora sp. NPDC048722]|uniref:DUF4436 family protein n=1 Tax=Kitasatospora sp. NPDC048722 TaxID=3155639 RepID=UPI0033CF5EFC
MRGGRVRRRPRVPRRTGEPPPVGGCGQRGRRRRGCAGRRPGRGARRRKARGERADGDQGRVERGRGGGTKAVTVGQGERDEHQQDDDGRGEGDDALRQPALGWMAATLFALAGFRNTAPGAPPIGCLLDHTAFLWAEAIVAFSVVYVVLRGTPVELAPPPAET